MAKYIIGDIHGCGQEFEELLNKLAFNPSRDELFLAGDLVGRGPEAKKVFDLAIKNDARLVLGNFDLHYIACAEGYRQASANDNFDSLLSLSKKERDYYLDWFTSHPFYLEEEGFILSHASLNPTWSLEECRQYSEMISEHFDELRAYFKGDLYIHVLRDPNFIKSPELRHSLEVMLTFMICRFFQVRKANQESIFFGERKAGELYLDVSKEPSAYGLANDDLSTFSTICKDGTKDFLDLAMDKGAPLCDFTNGHFPWFNLPQFLETHPEYKDNPNFQYFDKGKPHYFGHWSYCNGHKLPDGIICTDTSCVYGDELSAYLLPEKVPSKEALASLAEPCARVKSSYLFKK